VRKARDWLGRSGLRGEVIVVDNGSTDRSAQLAREAGARVVQEPQPGKGHAVRRGVQESRGRFLVLADADGTYDLSKLEQLVTPLQNGYDMVIGNRLRGAMESGSMPWLHRYVGNPLFGALISLMTRRRFGDCLSGLRAFRREAWETMAPQAPGFELESEMCLRAGRHNLRVAEVPTSYAVRRSPSKLQGLKHGWVIGRFILLESLDVLLVPLSALYFLLGAALLGAGLAADANASLTSWRWQLAFFGAVLLPAGVALATAAFVARWLAWRRRASPRGFMLDSLLPPRSQSRRALVALALAALFTGLALNAYMLWGWTGDSSPSLALAALALALTLSGLNLAVFALLATLFSGRSEL
jgi:cellulose synthase/poly-beta-1,6-N-acetylglucosamine synthase-like glycosyltransferase